jgi:molybdenum cofactor cytidylyltransferase
MSANAIQPAAAIILAAGASTRMGRPKQLLDFRGKPLIRVAAESALLAGCNPVIVVLGAAAEQIRPALNGLPVAVALNREWEKGMGTSIHTGLHALADVPTCGAVLVLADQPFVTGHFLRSLTEQHRTSGQAIVAARYSGTVGVPAFFAVTAFPFLLALKPQEGCKNVILGNMDDRFLVDCPEAAFDIDTPADYDRLAHA